MRQQISLWLVSQTLIGGVLCAAGCAQVPKTTSLAHAEPIAATAPQADREAILAMSGGYSVSFHFEETLQLDSAATPSETHDSEGHELVLVLKDEPNFISLQHLLLVGNKPHIIKHWRQDWIYEPQQILRYQGDMTWAWQPLAPEERRGAWTQTVYQVDDSPRYAGVGRWKHIGESAYWESDEAWRPLPRREHTHRDDYDVLVGQNRHALTPTGWIHAQDNYKLVRRDGQSRVLAWETGLNTYDRAPDYDFAPARAYWEKSAPYWEAVRAAWSDVMHRGERFTLARENKKEPLWDNLFALEETFVDSGELPSTDIAAAIEARLARSASETTHAKAASE
jgi:hypothetical protein